MENFMNYKMTDEEKKQWEEFGAYEYEGMLCEEVFGDIDYVSEDRLSLEQEMADEENWYNYVTEGWYE